MMVVDEISRAVEVPAACGIYQPSRIELFHNLRETKLGIVWVRNLTPSFIVDDLSNALSF